MTHGVKRAVWACVLVAASAHGGIVDIAWDTQGRFRHQGRIEPGKFAEVCGAVKLGQAITWHYEASAALEFNIHYHVGKDVSYPERRKAARASGTLQVTSSEDHCWMWVNKSREAVSFSLQLQR
jgi:hypothetical protein